jgi:hypothetical protein
VIPFNGDGAGSIGVNEFGGCAGPITSSNNTFNNVSTDFNTSTGCVNGSSSTTTTGTGTTGTGGTAPVAAVPEPSALMMLGSSLMLMFVWLLSKGRQSMIRAVIDFVSALFD